MEEINCLDCIYISDEYFDCEKWCGSKMVGLVIKEKKYEVI